jgi:hypothetical protein
MKRSIQILVCILIINTSFGQQKNFSLGTTKAGLGFGNFKTYSGVRLFLFDDNFKVSNGLSFGLFSEGTNSNGFSFTLLQNLDYRFNGININLLGGENQIANGLTISGLGQVCNKFNGVGFGGLAFCGDTLSGILISPIGMTWWNNNRIQQINGLTIGGIFGANCKELNGLSIGLFNNNIDTLHGVSIAISNRSKHLTGIQIGLWNVAENNRIFKRMPFINFNFRRKTRR